MAATRSRPSRGVASHMRRAKVTSGSTQRAGTPPNPNRRLRGDWRGQAAASLHEGQDQVSLGFLALVPA